MPGETYLPQLLKGLTPKLNDGSYAFCTVKDISTIDRSLTICEFKEAEGTTAVIEKEKADVLQLSYEYIASWITLMIHSSLDAVGLTAIFSTELVKKEHDINKSKKKKTMLGLVLLYWIGKYFYKLAEAHNKSKWGYAVLGIASYYIGIVVFSFSVGFISEIVAPGFIETMNELLLSIILIPFGILSCYALYTYLERQWKKEAPAPEVLINKIGEEEHPL